MQTTTPITILFFLSIHVFSPCTLREDAIPLLDGLSVTSTCDCSTSGFLNGNELLMKFGLLLAVFFMVRDGVVGIRWVMWLGVFLMVRDGVVGTWRVMWLGVFFMVKDGVVGIRWVMWLGVFFMLGDWVVETWWVTSGWELLSVGCVLLPVSNIKKYTLLS